jgi:hypothetical protein
MTHANVYDELSRRLYGFSRDIIKRTVLLHCYRAGDLDPWLVHLIKTELHNIEQELGAWPTQKSATGN